MGMLVVKFDLSSKAFSQGGYRNAVRRVFIGGQHSTQMADYYSPVEDILLTHFTTMLYSTVGYNASVHISSRSCAGCLCLGFVDQVRWEMPGLCLASLSSEDPERAGITKVLHC
jgi:hypothetical protein